MSRASVATLVVLAVCPGAPAAARAASAAIPAAAQALPAGYGKGSAYCAQYANVASRYSFDGVYACASTATAGPTPFDADGRWSFECVELSARFLWAVYGIWAGPGTGVKDGADLVAVVHRIDPRITVGVPGPGSVPLAGDVISLGPGGAVDPRFGHTAIVAAASRHTGFVTIISQNLPAGQAGEQTLRVGLRGRHNGRVLLGRIWTAARWLELRQPRRR
jgi:hypothetical protein